MTTCGVACQRCLYAGWKAVIARRMASDGWTVAVNFRSAPERAEAHQVVDDIRARGGTAGAFAADVTDEVAVADLATQVTSDLDLVEALIINATGPQPAVKIGDLTGQAHLDQLLFFVKSPTLLLQADSLATAVRRPAGSEAPRCRPVPARKLRRVTTTSTGKKILPDSSYSLDKKNCR